MEFEYRDTARATIDTILGSTAELEYQLKAACGDAPVTHITVSPLTGGLSGAAVLLVRRTGTEGPFKPWLAKISSDPGLIAAERENNAAYIQGVLSTAPLLIGVGSPRLLLFEFGGPLADYADEIRTLRSGYALSGAKALAPLMRRTVEVLHRLQRFSTDGVSCVERMTVAKDLTGKLESMKSPLSADLATRLVERWQDTLNIAHRYPRIISRGHGDLNSGNILFLPGVDASLPVIIDFASMRRSKDNPQHREGYHFPFWDYAKLERDIQTRLFPQDARSLGLSDDLIVAAIKVINGRGDRNTLPGNEAIAKLFEVTTALHESIEKRNTPNDYGWCYRTVLAYSMLSVLFREQPDSDIPQDLQNRVAAEASIALLSEPFSALIDRTADSPGTVEPRRHVMERSPSADLPPGEAINFIDHCVVNDASLQVVAGRGESASLRIELHWKLRYALEAVDAMNGAIEERMRFFRWYDNKAVRYRTLPQFRASFEQHCSTLRTVAVEMDQQFPVLLQYVARATLPEKHAAIRTFAALSAIRIVRALQKFHGLLCTSSGKVIINFFPDLPPIGNRLLALFPFYSTVGLRSFSEAQFLSSRVYSGQSFEHMLLPRFEAERLQDAKPESNAYYSWIVPQWLLWPRDLAMPSVDHWTVSVLSDAYGRELGTRGEQKPWKGDVTQAEPGHAWLKEGDDGVEEIELKPKWFVWCLAP